MLSIDPQTGELIKTLGIGIIAIAVLGFIVYRFLRALENILNQLADFQKQAMSIQIKMIETFSGLQNGIDENTKVANDQLQEIRLSREETRLGRVETTNTGNRMQQIVDAFRTTNNDMVAALSATSTTLGDKIQLTSQEILDGAKNIMEGHDKTSKDDHLEIKNAVRAIPPDIKQYVDAQGAAQIEALRSMMSQLEAQIQKMASPTVTADDMKAVLAALDELKTMLAQLLEQTAKPKTTDPLAIVTPKPESGEGKSA